MYSDNSVHLVLDVVVAMVTVVMVMVAPVMVVMTTVAIGYSCTQLGSAYDQ